MRDIYYHAARVLVWLGGEEIYSEGIRVMKEMRHDINNQAEAPHEIRKRLFHLLSLDDEDERMNNVASLFGDMAHSLFGNLGSALVRRFRDRAEDGFAQDWNAIIQVFRSPWWNRGWIHQEVIVSKETEIITCSETIPWASFGLVFFHVMTPVAQIITTPFTKIGTMPEVSDATRRMMARSVPDIRFGILSVVSMSSYIPLKDGGGDQCSQQSGRLYTCRIRK
jgi:hypothetical protein